MIRKTAIVLAGTLILLAGIRTLVAQKAEQASATAIAVMNSEMADAVTKLWSALSPDQQAKIGFAFDDPERTNWHFTPVTRKGLPWKDMTPLQRDLGHALLKIALSQRGYEKADAIQQHELILGDLENHARERDPQNYYFSIFGKPGTGGAWAWRFEGHHVAFNFTFAADKAAVAAPNFLGSNPAKVPEGKPKAGLRILAAEEDLGRKLIRSLSSEQQKVAIFDQKAPGEIITGEQQRPDPLKPTGIPAAQLDPEHQRMLRTLVEEYAGRLRAALFDQEMQKIDQAGFEKVYFAWAGTTEEGGPHYYRVQGPTFLIEYDDTQNNANHIHAVWRDAADDFGQDILKRHYAQYAH